MSYEFKYPEVRRDDSVVEDCHGYKVPDPYRWLEDLDGDETGEFVDTQGKLTSTYLKTCTFYDDIKEKIKTRINFPRYGCPYKRGKRYFYAHNTGLQNQSVIYMQDSLDDEPRVFFDPNELSEDSTVSITKHAFSKDGSIWAVALSQSGSDWTTIKFRDVETGQDLPDVLERTKFSSLCFTLDNKGIFYNTFPDKSEEKDEKKKKTDKNKKLYYHVMGTDQSEDVLVTEFPDHPEWTHYSSMSNCRRYLILTIYQSCDPCCSLYVCDLSQLKGGIKGPLPWIKVIDDFEFNYSYVTNEGPVFTMTTNNGAPNEKIINIDIQNPAPENWVTLVEENPKLVLAWVRCVNQNVLVVCYMEDCKDALFIFDLTTGNLRQRFPLDIGTIGQCQGRKEDTTIFYSFTSFLTPSIIYSCDMSGDTLEPKVFREVTVPDFKASDFTTQQVFYESKDGTSVPMFIVHKKDLVLDGTNPALLNGYGGFSISLGPYFSSTKITLMGNLSCVYAVANIRGGGEYGRKWYEGGRKETKQNCFDDFCAAAEYLIKHKFTSPNRLAIEGGSNGGLLVGACINQRPDLFRAAIPNVGVMDITRFHKFHSGALWTSDYGDPDKKEDFEVLFKYSPLHNIPQSGTSASSFPAVLAITGDHDDRVPPLHTFKYVAELQHRLGATRGQKNPLLIRVEKKAGHGAGSPLNKVIAEMTDEFSFLSLTLGLKWSAGVDSAPSQL